MSDDRTLIEQLDVLRAATMLAAGEIVARDKDGSFLEKTLRDALAARFPGASTEQSLSLDRALWPGRLRGVDVLYATSNGTHVGVETKVWDVADSLHEIFKLAAGTQATKLAAGFCVIAGRGRDWRATSTIRDMSETTKREPVEWDTATLLRDDARGWSRTAIRPSNYRYDFARSPASRSRCRECRITRSGSSASRPSAPSASDSIHSVR